MKTGIILGLLSGIVLGVVGIRLPSWQFFVLTVWIAFVYYKGITAVDDSWYENIFSPTISDIERIGLEEFDAFEKNESYLQAILTAVVGLLAFAVIVAVGITFVVSPF